MGRKRFDDMHCSVAQALEALGDWWTLLIVRDAFFGRTRFSEFEKSLGIAKNVLSQRLQHLVEHGILAREPAGPAAHRHAYRLTDKGRDLLVVLTALREWGDRWVYGEGREPVVVLDRRSGERLPTLRLRDAGGEPIAARDLRLAAGPGGAPEARRTPGAIETGPAR